MNATDYAYEWLEETASERNESNLSIDEYLLDAFVAGYDTAKQDITALQMWLAILISINVALLIVLAS